MRLWSFTQAPSRLTKKIHLQTAHQITMRSGGALMKFIWSAAACQGVSLRIGSRLKANSKVRRSLCERRQEKNTDRDISNSSKRRSSIERSQSNGPPATSHTQEGHVANGHPDGSPRYFCLRLRSGPGSHSDADAGGRSGHGRTTRCPRVQRMGSDVGRLCERPDPTPSLRLHNQAKLHRRFARSQRPGAVRNRSEALQGG